jgi:orotate phosphoribosyltransferase
MQQYQRAFIELAVSRNALRFGSFKLKSGRISPYFFNAGLLSDGAAAAILGQGYAAALMASGVQFDVLFGPAYKGIPLVTATAIALATHHNRNVPYVFNRKESKDHGEGGVLVGGSLQGRVVIIDDVITAGSAARESIELIGAAGGTPVALTLALDRQERGAQQSSAVEELATAHGLTAISIIRLADLIDALAQPGSALSSLAPEHLTALRAYRAQYGTA